MRVMVFGNKMMTQRITVSLAGGGNEVLSSSSRSEAMALLKQKRFDVAVVDGLMEGGEEVCRCIREHGNVPVLLMEGRRQAEWQKLELLEPDGYILEGMAPAELRAYLQAVVRRCSLNFYVAPDRSQHGCRQ